MQCLPYLVRVPSKRQSAANSLFRLRPPQSASISKQVAIRRSCLFSCRERTACRRILRVLTRLHLCWVQRAPPHSSRWVPPRSSNKALIVWWRRGSNLRKPSASTILWRLFLRSKIRSPSSHRTGASTICKEWSLWTEMIASTWPKWYRSLEIRLRCSVSPEVRWPRSNGEAKYRFRYLLIN